MITLDEIRGEVHRQLERRKRLLPQSELLSTASPRTWADLVSYLPRNRTNIIAEIKRASPSEGTIAPSADPVQLAGSYLRNGAAGLSILTEEVFFNGSIQFIRKVKEHYPSAFILMKDFIVDEYQLAEGLNAGADAVLLILGLLGKDAAKQLMRKAADYKLHALVEVHDENEMRQAASLNATFVGVNNRNLKTMQVNVATSEALVGLSPPNCVLISESGLKEPDQISRLSRMGYRGFLIGTHFMKSPDPGGALANMINIVDADKN